MARASSAFFFSTGSKDVIKVHTEFSVSKAQLKHDFVSDIEGQAVNITDEDARKKVVFSTNCKY